MALKDALRPPLEKVKYSQFDQDANPKRGWVIMSLRDPFKLELAKRHLLDKKVCRNCGATNPLGAVKCRKCHSKNLRLKRKKAKGR
jgi:large subunit ribosomal protein L40e